MYNYQVIADELFEAERTGIPIPQISARYALTEEEAYQIQRLNRERWLRNDARIIGKKIGLSSRAMQQSLGLQTQVYGFLLDTKRNEDGIIPKKSMLQPRVEGELAFVLKERLSADATPEEVLRATDAILPAIEILDSRLIDWKLRIVDTIADNACSGLFRLGETRIDPATQLETLRMTLYKNGEMVNADTAKAVMGNPVHAVVGLAKAMTAMEVTLEPGDIVLSGAITEPVAAVPGDRFTCDFGPFGAVTVQFEE